MATDLLEPVVEDGIRLTNFFNGRVLTAEDLRREQDAERDLRRGVAGALGEGVVRGLEVKAVKGGDPLAPTVKVSAGLAFNRDGDPVALPREVEVRLIPAQAESGPDAGIFTRCEAAPITTNVTDGGFWLLAARPASKLSSDRVAAVELDSEGVGTGCGSRYAELGASFSLVPLPLSKGSEDAPLAKRLTEIRQDVDGEVKRVRAGETGPVVLQLAKHLSLLRNGMAYWCSGYDVAAGRLVSLAVPGPSVPSQPPPPLEMLRSGALASCDVPLALLFVSERGLEWVDMWSVRRPPAPRLGPDPLPLVAESVAPADAAAWVMQFRDHASMFLASDSPMPPEQVQAREWFLFLPPAGVLPLHTGTTAGFFEAVFFSNTFSRGTDPLLVGAVESAVRQALVDPPIPLLAPAPLVYRYQLRNMLNETVDWSTRYLPFFSRAVVATDYSNSNSL